MNDNFEKISRIDNEGISKKEDVFLNKSLQDYKKIMEMIKTIMPESKPMHFSKDVKKFEEDCLAFMSYIKQCVEDSEISVVSIIRQGNQIKYGKYHKGSPLEKHVIEMISDEDLKKLYQLLQTEFSPNFVTGWKHTFGMGWSLVPTIGETVMLNIDSDNDKDHNWFYEESHKKDTGGLSKKI